MKIEEKIILLLIPILAVTLLPLVFADYTQTTVFFDVPTSKAFTVTLPGQTAVSSNTTNNPNSPPTANIEFNATNPTTNNIVPCTVGGTGNCQSGMNQSGTPILQYKNTGNANISILLDFNSTLPAGVTVRGNSSWANTSVSNGTTYSQDIAVNATDNGVFASSVDWQSTSIVDVYLFANFSAVSAGTRKTGLLNSSST